MRRMSLVLPLAFSSVVFVAVTVQSADKPQILSTLSRIRVTPGVLFDVSASVPLDGTATTASLLQDLAARFVQGARSHSAGLRAAHLTRRPPNEQESPGAVIGLVVTVPAGLQDGPADLIVSYRKSESDPKQVEVSLQPPAPGFAFMTVSLDGRLPDPKTLQRPPLEFVRGRKAEARIYPIVDPDTNNAVLCTFRQAGKSFSVHASVEAVAVFNEKGFSSPRYRVMVVVPDDLQPGDAVLEARLSVGGIAGPAAESNVVILASDNPIEERRIGGPKIVGVRPMQAGRGQSIQVAVAQMRTLLPSPEKTSIVLVSPGERILLRPTMNSAVNPVTDDPTAFAILQAVLPDAVTGRVTVHVLNPELGEADGLSQGVDIEIMDEVVLPRIIEIAEASVTDLLPLSTLRAQMLAAGSECPVYDPKYRYLSIRAEDLDQNPNNILIQCKQDDNVVTLEDEDFSLIHGTLRIVRVPERIHSGRVEVIVANRSGGRTGPPASAVLVLSR